MSNKQLVGTESSSMVQSNTLIPVEAAQIEILAELTHDEEDDRYRLELGVEQAFYQAGKALAELRYRRLYRSTHKTFDAYCQDRFGFSRRHSDYLIAGAVVVDNLQEMRTMHSQDEDFNENLSTIRAQIMPTKLEQIKPLACLKPEEQRRVWDEAIATAHGKVPSGRIVKRIVEQLKDKPLVLAQDCCQVGDVFTLVRLESQEKKYNGCWAIAKRCQAVSAGEATRTAELAPQGGIAVEPRDFTVLVDVHDTTLTVRLDNLDKIDSPDVKRQLPQILQRMRRLRKIDFLDRGADNFLDNVGKHTHLTVVEEGLLSWLEKYYRVDEQEGCVAKTEQHCSQVEFSSIEFFARISLVLGNSWWIILPRTYLASAITLILGEQDKNVNSVVL